MLINVTMKVHSDELRLNFGHALGSAGIEPI